MNGKRYWADGTPVAGQQFEYGFDDIGNRTSTKAGGDANGLGLRSATYSANSLNQYTSRTVPGAVDVVGIAHADATNTVNGQAPYRKGEYYWKELALDNSSALVYAGVTNRAVLSGATNTVTGSVFLARSPENYSYDADGNLTGDGRWTNQWDAENRLIAMESLAALPTAAKRKLVFAYDDNGRRVSKSVSTNSGSGWVLQYTRKFVYDGWPALRSSQSGGGNLIAELDGNKNRVRSYLWGTDLSGSLQGAGGVGGLLAINDAANGMHFVAYDANGNVIGLVKATDGTVSARYEYDPFGQTIRVSGTAVAAVNPYRFSTKYDDPESHFLYYGQRYYNPSTGRWLSRDPIWEEGGRNLSAFSRNDGVNHVDPLGHRFEPPPWIDRCADPCGYAKAHGVAGTANGGVVCCKGEKYVCVWNSSGNSNATDPIAMEVIGACTRVHEEQHVPNSSCPKICGWGWPTIADIVGDPIAEHCRIYSIEIQCLQSHLADCGENAQCIEQLQTEIEALVKVAELYCRLSGGIPEH